MIQVPKEISQLIGKAEWQKDSLGHSLADVFFIKRDQTNLYLKVSQDSLEIDYKILNWLEHKLPVPKVYYYDVVDGYHFLLMTEVIGDHAASPNILADPESFVRLYAEGLKMIHSIAKEDCPFDQRLSVKMKQAKGNMQRGLVDEEDFEEKYQGIPVEKLYQLLQERCPENEDLVFTHGDYCLPNIIIRDGEISGFIDIGHAGLADRYQDIALAIRSLKHNGLQEWTDTFTQYYGLQEIDWEKVEFYILLDEFF